MLIADWILLLLRAAAPILLFLFLGLTLYRMLAWHRALNQSTPPVTPGPVPVAYLRRIDPSEAVLSLEAETSLVQNPKNFYILDSERVTARQALFTYRERTWWITNLGDSDDIAVNARPIESATALAYGDVILLGDIAFRLEQGGQA